jgi:transposase
MAVTAISVLGVDLGKNLCSVVGLDAAGAVAMRRKVRRETLIALAEKLPPCVVWMEACCAPIISAACLPPTVMMFG